MSSNPNHPRCLVLTLAAVLSIVPLASPLLSQGDGLARAVPLSENKIIGKLIADDGSEFRFMVKDGGMLRVTRNEPGEKAEPATAFIFGLNPETRDASDPTILIQEFSIYQHKSGGGDVVTAINDALELHAGDRRQTSGAFSIEIETTNKIATNQTKVDLFYKRIPVFEMGTCCVSCGWYTVCGCAVSACGSQCCSGSCCGGGGLEGPAHQGF